MKQSKGKTNYDDPSLVRENVARILDDKSLDHDPTQFSFHKCYEDAPNPTLDLPALGLVGVPLSEREAQAVASQCKPNPVEMKDHPEMRSSCGIWEMEPQLVTCSNPKWSKFMAQVTTDVCKALDVEEATSHPRCELSKLLLYEPGSAVGPHMDSSHANGTFATIHVVLPSFFTGGAVQLSHAGTSTSYETDEHPYLKTSVLAWYPGVTFEMKPITAGHRLVLSYSLIHTTKAPCPSLHAISGLARRVRKVLKAWKKARVGDAPERIFIILDDDYKEDGLKGSALEDRDARTLALFETIAKEHDFSLGLANAEITLSGTAEDAGHRWQQREPFDDDSWCSYGPGRRSPRGGRDRDPDSLPFADVNGASLKLSHLVRLDGDLISEKVDFDEDFDVIPLELMEEMQDEDHDEQHYQPDPWKECPGRLMRTYYRTAFAIWPSDNDACDLSDYDEGVSRSVTRGTSLEVEHVPTDAPPTKKRKLQPVDEGDTVH